MEIEGKNLFLNYQTEEIEGLGTFEVYPNRDSVPYKEIYGLKNALSVKRGTYRYPGWCPTFKKIVDLGLVDETPDARLKGKTYRQMLADLVDAASGEDVAKAAARKLGLAGSDEILRRLEWLGLFENDPLPALDNRLDVLCHRLEEKLFYKEGEKDMLLLKHTFIVENKKKKKEKITSTLIDYGIPFGDTSMARTVSLPMAIGTRMMAEGRIALTGVLIPVLPEIYEPILKELETLNIKMEEKRVPLA